MMGLPKVHFTVLLSCISVLLIGCGSAPKRDLDLDRIRAEWSAVASPATRELAPLPASDVDRMLDAWSTNGVRKDEREFLSRLVETRVKLFNATVAAARDRARLDELEDRRKDILLTASRRDAEQARLEAEKFRLQNMLRAEEAERFIELAQDNAVQLEESEREVEQAREEAQSALRLAQAQGREAQLARREAELLSAETVDLRAQLAGLRPENSTRGRMLVLGDVFFATGQGELRDEARDSIEPVKAFIERFPGLPVSIEGHTDSRGSAAANLRLSERRASSVRDALLAVGVDASRLTVTGLGKAKPIASNDSSVGQARNRRVEVIVVGSK
jgi:outer membrane protein OmpA-like peptidoglycan-associated protein